MHSIAPYAADDIKRKRRRREGEELYSLIEYKINEFLSLKLEKGKTQIYVKDKRFLQCKRLALNISKKDIPIYDEINSIDEAADVYQKHLYQNKIVEGPLARDLHEDHDITPEEEFWGHCSNLQMWYENDYDTRLLHSNLAFYLLKALVDAGDPIARRVFKNEVAERFESGYPNVIISIVNAKLLDYFTLEEKRELIRPNVPIILKCAPELLDLVKEVEIHSEPKIKDLYLLFNNLRLASYGDTFKIIVLGDADTPKTSLTIRYISGFYLEDIKLTIGVDFYSKTTLYKGKKIKLQIWDFGGEERFRFLLHQYCKGANAALFLYNITNPSTLDHLPDWIQIIRENSGDIPIILVGAKAHLEEFRAVSREEGILAAKKYNLSGFIEVSAKTGQNVEKAFELITAILVEKYSTEIA